MAIIARLNAEVDRKRVATISQTGNDGHRVQVRKCRGHEGVHSPQREPFPHAAFETLRQLWMTSSR
jgi:hypothetical protein